MELRRLLRAGLQDQGKHKEALDALTGDWGDAIHLSVERGLRRAELLVIALVLLSLM